MDKCYSFVHSLIIHSNTITKLDWGGGGAATESEETSWRRSCWVSKDKRELGRSEGGALQAGAAGQRQRGMKQLERQFETRRPRSLSAQRVGAECTVSI